MPRLGDFKRKIELQAPTKTSDGMGGTVLSYVTVATVLAKMNTLRTDEAILAMQSTGTAIHNILIRYRTDVKSSWRVKYSNRLFNVIGPPIDVDFKHRWLDVKVKEAPG